MKKVFEVSCTATYSKIVTVEADSADEAETIVQNELWDGHYPSIGNGFELAEVSADFVSEV